MYQYIFLFFLTIIYFNKNTLDYVKQKQINEIVLKMYPNYILKLFYLRLTINY